MSGFASWLVTCRPQDSRPAGQAAAAQRKLGQNLDHRFVPPTPVRDLRDSLPLGSLRRTPGWPDRRRCCRILGRHAGARFEDRSRHCIDYSSSCRDTIYWAMACFSRLACMRPDSATMLKLIMDRLHFNRPEKQVGVKTRRDQSSASAWPHQGPEKLGQLIWGTSISSSRAPCPSCVSPRSQGRARWLVHGQASTRLLEGGGVPTWPPESSFTANNPSPVREWCGRNASAPLT